jgi:hypothetical protein
MKGLGLLFIEGPLLISKDYLLCLLLQCVVDSRTIEVLVYYVAEGRFVRVKPICHVTATHY